MLQYLGGCLDEGRSSPVTDLVSENILASGLLVPTNLKI